MKQLLLFFTFFFVTITYAQQQKIDSLKTVLNQKSQNEKEATKQIHELYIICKSEIDKSDIEIYKQYINLLLNEARIQKKNKYISLGSILLSDKYQRIADYDNALKTINESIKLTKNNLNDSLRIMNYTQKANVFKFFDKNDSSLVYFDKAIVIGEKSKQYRPLGYAYNGLSSLYMNQGNYIDAIKTAHKSLEISAKHHFNELEVSNLIGLGNLYLKTEDYKKSLDFFFKAKDKFNEEKIENIELECDIFRFIGLNYSRNGNVQEGNLYNQKAINCYKLSGNLLLASDVLNTIGANYLRQGQFKKSIPYFEELINNSLELKHRGIEIYGSINLSSAFIETNNLNKGEVLLYNILKDTINPEILSKGLEKIVYQNLSDLYDRKKMYKESLENYKKFKFLEDSILSTQKLKEVAEIDIKYQTEKKEKENLQLKAEKAEQAELIALESKRKWQMAGGLAMAFVGFGVFGFYYRRNKKQKEAIENLQRELHHRVKNNLSIIDTFIDVVKDEFNDDAINNKLSELQNRIDSINEVHKQLFASANVTDLNLKKYIDTLANNVQQSFPNNNISIEQHIDNSIKISPEKSFPLGLIINEFITNSYKYAFNDANGKIEMTLKEIDGVINVSLSDNGKGLPKDFNPETSPSFGLRIIKLLSQQLKGTYHLESKNGVHLNMQFPK
jgi:two-component sensor histidine kinase